MLMPHFPLPTWQNQVKYDLDNIKRLLKVLGNPHLSLPPVIHIAGTNGKGSSSAMLKSIFTVAGYKVHCYTSPHLLEFNERIIVAGEKISDNALWQVCEHVRIVSEKFNIEASFFEGTTAAAFLAFAQTKADILILETGLGGRLDATNIFEHPLITLITPISYDHMNVLGNTLQMIAVEKAGIMKACVPCVISMQTLGVYATLFARAQELDVPTFCYEYDFGIQKTDNGFIYASRNFTYEFPSPSLLGDHQLINAASVIALISLINQQFYISNAIISKGLQNTVWQARIEKIEPQKYSKLIGENVQIWVDAAHNNSGAQVLANWVRVNLKSPIYLILGMTKNRDIKAFCSYFNDLTIKGYGVKVLSEPLSHSAAIINLEGRKSGIDFSESDSLEAAISDINKRNGDNKTNIIITGSLYLASDFYKLLSNCYQIA
ncbi:folylpolyglutamate synthase/dihydrofolate synthase family protein [Rickettsia typhi]|uniref:tetrahydrofolate synthase n=2 Tax=Rickettsia typhi TaxID=785 RepID=Q68WJ9_RICTY|nr:folylpolyglutamate synthase/dihydrofolate synthase family protein [Rickettsia typhi]AAU03993.1 Folate polyglutamate synthetase [Rickettsia typhi str. Wilmington]AFE54373.1 folylpolyglutamate synthase [Rickettsia typhi str. TH1527]AFE55211.1 folylpolyglutamate synthase [Rickettsia typhi str. B9991CWPP]